jgi:hypothetical protein
MSDIDEDHDDEPRYREAGEIGQHQLSDALNFLYGQRSLHSH